jgi:hypothetical protein
MRRIKIILTLLFTVFVVGAHAQSKVGTTVAPFLTIGTGAHGSSVGHAYTASARGADALFWNPSGISIRTDAQPMLGSAMFTNYDWFADITYNAFGVTVPVSGNSVIGLSIAMVDYGSMDVRTIDQPEGTGEKFNASDMLIGLSYARPLTTNFYIGGTAKYIRQSIWDTSAETFAVDIGFTLVTEYLNGLRLGATLNNFGGSMQLDGINLQESIDPDLTYGGNNDNVPVRYKMDEWNIPIQFKFGVAWPVVTSKMVDWEIMLESDQTNDQYLNLDAGTDIALKMKTVTVHVRSGYRDIPLDSDYTSDDVDNHWTFGGGVNLNVSNIRMGLGFAWLPFNNLQDTKLFDVRLYF